MDDALKGRRIEVHTNQGVVTLRGEVGSDTERGQALLLARTTEGVTRVEDNLTVNAAAAAPPLPATSTATGSAALPAPSPSRTTGDEAIATRIQSKFFTDPQVRAAAVQVSAKDGVVVLEGTVPSAAAKKQALTLARNTEGVQQVIDRLTVGKTK
jgi:hyperosmotically inducible protein